MSNIKHLTLVQTTGAKPNEHAVAMAKDLLAMCESGDIQTLIVIGLCPDNAVIDGWSNGEDVRPYTIIGALEKLKYEFMQRNIEDR